MTRIALVGAGAVGGVIAWHLVRAGFDPLVVGRPQSTEALTRDGLTVSHNGDEATVRVRASADPAAHGLQDIVLVGFKGQDWLEGYRLVKPLLGPDTVLVPLLNGIPWWFFDGIGGALEGRVVESVDPGGRLLAEVPRENLLGGVIYIGAERDGVTRIRWNGRKRLIIGRPGPRSKADAAGIAALLSPSGLNVEPTDDIRRAVWTKLFGNVSYNPLSALTGARMGRLAGHPPLRRILAAMMSETVAVGRALGVCDEVNLEPRLNLPPEMLEVKTSMLQDQEAGRPLELAGIVDAVIELAGLVNVPVPILETIGALTAEHWWATHGVTG